MRCLVLALVLLTSASAGAELRAEQITQESAARLDVGGPDAIGGVGDWWLSNDVVEAVVDDVSRAHAKSNHGGTLVDLGLRDRRAEDQFARLIPLLNLSQRVVAGYDAIRAELDPEGRWARLVVSSSGVQVIPRGSWISRKLDPLVPAPEELAEVVIETIYELRPGESFLRLVTSVENRGSRAAPLFAFGDLWMRGGRSGRGFHGDVLDPTRSWGFAARKVIPSLTDSGAALSPFTHLALVGSRDFPPIAYAYAAPERAARGLPLHGMLREHASVALAWVGDPELEELSLTRLAGLLLGELEPGESWRFERRLLVSGRRETAAVSDLMYAELGRETGRVSGEVQAGARAGSLLVETADGFPVTQLALPRFEAVLPPGEYAAVLRVEHAPEQRGVFTVRAGRTTRIAFDPIPPPAWLVFRSAFADGGPGRIEVRGRDGTPDPVIGDDQLGATLNETPAPSASASSALLFVGNASDPTEVALPPGRYVLTATRGFDWEIASQELELSEPGTRQTLAPFELVALEPLEGYVAADLHVHAEASDDSQATNAERLRRFVAEGVGVVVASDHDHVSDYGPALARLGLADRLRVVTGVEVTSSTPSLEAPWTLGHHNAWPIPLVPHAHRDGAPQSQNRSIHQLYTELRRDHGAGVVQLNHPRAGAEPGDAGLSGHFFEHLGSGERLDPRRLGDAPEGALDFDAIELMNGQGWDGYLATRRDWIALQRAGLRRSATANSDTHGPGELAAYPRNYVHVGPGDDFDAALRAGRSFGTSGPRVRRFTVEAASLGETAEVPEGRVRVDFAVDAASWVPLEEVRVLVNGEVVHAGPEREGQLEIVMKEDAFVHLEAGAPLDTDREEWLRSHPGPYTEIIAPGFVSAAFTNAIFVRVAPAPAP